MRDLDRGGKRTRADQTPDLQMRRDPLKACVKMVRAGTNKNQSEASMRRARMSCHAGKTPHPAEELQRSGHVNPAAAPL